jgi:hypothetical protein
LWLLLGNALIPPLRLFVRYALACDQTNAAFHLALVQRVLAPVEFSFWFFDLATPIRTRAEGNVAVLQCSGLGRFLLFYAALIFPLAIGTLQFAVSRAYFLEKSSFGGT